VAKKQHGKREGTRAKGKTLFIQMQAQETRLPKIESRKTDRQESSLPKLQSEKKIITKWLESSREKGNSKI